MFLFVVRQIVLANPKLLGHGVDRAVIALWLGHESVDDVTRRDAQDHAEMDR